jgi:GH25 family lysozyme M1 (1,4-beta-N-acetylmuramidase)
MAVNQRADLRARRENALRRLIELTHRRALALMRLAHHLANLSKARRAELARLLASEATRTTGRTVPYLVKGGPDSSAYQGRVKVSRITDSGHYDIGIRKATGGLSYVDPGFARDWRALRFAHHLHRGVYYFARPQYSARSQARFFFRTVKAAGLRLTDILILDIEVGASSGLDGRCDEFFQELQRLAPHNDLWSYTSEDWRAWRPRPGRRCWVANYNWRTDCGPPLGLAGHVVLHQFTDRALVPGIPGPCDLSVVPNP